MPDAPPLDGDERLFGVKMREHPSQVPPNYVAEAINTRFTAGVPEPRGGCVHLPWLNKILPKQEFVINYPRMGRYEVIYGEGRFKDANNVLWNLQAADGAVYACLPNNVPRTLPLPAGITITDDVTFEQLGAAVIMMRGDDLDPLQMTAVSLGWTAVPDPTPGTGSSRIPRGRRALAAGGRLWVMTGSDQLWASDELDHTAYVQLNKFRFSDGTADDLVTIAVFGKSNIIGLKERSIWRLTNITTADAIGILDGTYAETITKRYGCVAANSVVDLGTDLQWWSQEGPASLTITVQNEVLAGQGQEQPLPGQDIVPLLRRVNQSFRSGIVAAFWENKVYWAVPLDDGAAVRFDYLNGVSSLAASERVLLEAGATYRYTKKSAETSLMDNSAGSLTGSNDFESGGEVNFTTTGITLLTSTLQRVYKGVNNAVLVFDFAATDRPGGAWAGYDQTSGLEPKYFFLSMYLGRDRLCFAGADGWTCLYEEGYEDHLPNPTLDVELPVTKPTTGDTLRINGGTIVTANVPSGGNTAPTTWGGATLLALQQFIWVDASVVGGFYSAPNQWSSPGAVAVKLSDGVRFYSLDGSVPIAVTSGAWPTLTTSIWKGIQTRLVTRGYATDARLRRKRALRLACFFETYEPTYSIAVRSDGVNRDVEFISDRTRSRTQYDRPFSRAPWTATNVNDDFATPGRQDYSLLLNPDFKLSGASTAPGLQLGLQQAVPHFVTVNGKSRAHQLIITNSTGRLRLIACGFEGRYTDRGVGIKDS